MLAARQQAAQPLGVEVVSVVADPSGRLLLPMMRRLIEYSAVMTRMPAISGLILNLVCSTPVAVPAIIPAAKARSVAASGE